MPDPEVWVLLDAVAAPAVDGHVLPGEREVLEAFRLEQLAPGRSVGSLRVRRSAGAAAAAVGLFLASGTAAAAATGVLPGPAQRLAHTWFDRVGILVPDAGGSIVRDDARTRRGAGHPDRTLPPVTRPLELDPRPSPSFGSATERPARLPMVLENVRPVRGDHRSSGTDTPAPPASTRRGSVEASAIIVTPAPQGAAPATPPGSAPGTPPGSAPGIPSGASGEPPSHPHASPPPAAPAAPPPGEARDQRRDPATPATPASTGEAGPVVSPMPQLDRHQTTERTTQRRSR
jgi:hypothetical protein